MLSRAHHSGSTLLELLVVLVILAMVGGAIMHLTVGEERFLATLDEVTEMQRTVREGADIPRYELRSVAPASGGIYEAADDHVDFRSLTGSSVLCSVDSSLTTLSIPDRLAWSALTTWIAAPREGDTVLVLDADTDGVPPTWRVHTLLTAPAPGGSCPPSTGLARNSADEVATLAFRLAAPLEPTVTPGAALRFVRRARYALYRAGDDLWYLGYLDCAPARAVPCSAIQPISGPFAPGGVRFLFRDAVGASTSEPADVKRIDVLSRTTSSTPLRAIGFALGLRTDSALTSVAPRNR
jgi:type II secretory pathway pseudopilin PulG